MDYRVVNFARREWNIHDPETRSSIARVVSTSRKLFKSFSVPRYVHVSACFVASQVRVETQRIISEKVIDALVEEVRR